MFGTITEFAVTIDLKRGEVVELGWLLLTFLFLHFRHRERFAFDGGKRLLTLFFIQKLTLRRGKGRITIDSRKYPIRFGFEVVDF